MRFAVRVPTSNRVSGREALVDVAQAAEALGYYAISAHDHLVFNGWWVACGARDAVGTGDDRDMYEALTTLSFLAGKTERVRLMTAILLLPTREVVLAAKQVATLDALSGGRVVLGVGVGAGSARGSGAEHDANDMQLGAHQVNAQKEVETFKVPAGRGRLANEQLQAMRAIWTADQATFAGEFVQFRAIECFPKPAQPGGPPILVGGRSAAALRRVVDHGDGWLPASPSPAQYAEGVAVLRRLAAARGRPAPAYYGLNVFATVAATDAAAEAMFAPTMGQVFAGEGLRERNLVGSPATVVQRLQAYQAAGVNLVEMKPIYPSVSALIGMLELVAREVMPAFAGESSGEAGAMA